MKTYPRFLSRSHWRMETNPGTHQCISQMVSMGTQNTNNADLASRINKIRHVVCVFDVCSSQPKNMWRFTAIENKYVRMHKLRNIKSRILENEPTTGHLQQHSHLTLTQHSPKPEIPDSFHTFFLPTKFLFILFLLFFYIRNSFVAWIFYFLLDFIK